MKNMDRRHFIAATAVIGAHAVMPRSAAGRSPAGRIVFPSAGATATRPVVISSANGLAASARAMELIRSGADTLDAVVAGVNIVEDDPEDTSVGYGGLPNENGIVELDASVMHGPTGRGAGVAALRNIRHASSVAKIVMERTDHVLLVGEGALQFARMHGFPEENLLTEKARKLWLEWKENMSKEDDWLPPHDIHTKDIGELHASDARHTGTINCCAVNDSGDLSGCTTTSGLSFKIPGRVGDSPILGAGLYVDNEVGAAGSTGRGEANLLACSSVIVVEQMRAGKSPEEACLAACTRIAEQTKMRRLLDDKGRPNFDVKFYALRKDGAHGSACIWSGGKYAVNTGGESRLLESAYLYKRGH